MIKHTFLVHPPARMKSCADASLAFCATLGEILSMPMGILPPHREIVLKDWLMIDAYIESTHTLIEQKSIDKDLSERIGY